MTESGTGARRFLAMLALVLAGEAVFALPFHVARFFRPTVLDAFSLTNTELGAAQGVYGIVAMLAYFPGGPLADRFPARKLMACSLWATAAGGLYMATLPGYQGAAILWGFFGLTTILLFWAALIRATREWGGPTTQGRAYGLLEGGRGALAALLASIAVLVMADMFPADAATATIADKQRALRWIIYGYAAVTAGVGVLVWFLVRDGPRPEARAKRGFAAILHSIVLVVRIPSVWLQAVIVVCAYVGFKGMDDLSIYAVDGYGMDAVEAAQVVTIGSWARPIAAMGAGLLGDRLRVSRVTIAAFALLLVSDVFFAWYAPGPNMAWVLFTNVLLTSAAVYGLRGLYFALFEEARVPAAVTGTAVGLVSVIGYTPDVFVNVVGGVLVDGSPGVVGHQHFFWFLAGFALLGLSAAMATALVHRRP